MATRAFINVMGVDRNGLWFFEPAGPGAASVLAAAMRAKEPLEIRLVMPTRGKRRRAANHKLKLTSP